MPASGLAAATAGASADLGALGRDDGAIALASLDGEADEAIIEPTSLAAASFAPPTTKPPATKPAPATARPATAPAAPQAPHPAVDMFAAPEEESEMELALDVDVEKQKKAATAAAVVSLPGGAPARDSKPALGMAPPRAATSPSMAAAADAPARPARPAFDLRKTLADAKVRFAAGVLAAVLIGFLPAMIVGSIRMGSAFAAIDQKLDAQQAQITTVEEYEALDRTRALALERKYAERKDIAITAFLIWAVVGGAVAYTWFRRVPWDRVVNA
jgi:hypothetical protein